LHKNSNPNSILLIVPVAIGMLNTPKRISWVRLMLTAPTVFNATAKQGFRDTKAIFCLLGKLPNPHRTLPAASGCASVPDALTAVPAKEKSPVQHEHYTHTAPDIPSSTALSIFFFLPHFLLMQLLFFLLVLFQDFLHNLLCHKPILHFRFGLAVLRIKFLLLKSGRRLIYHLEHQQSNSR
jgi:hypothetical protein